MTGRINVLDELVAAVAPERRREIAAELLDFGAKHYHSLEEPERKMVLLLAEDIAAEPGLRSLDKTLGFREHGGKSPAKTARLDQRNTLLVALWRNHEDWCDLAPSAAARLMVTSFRRYEAGRWPRERDDLTPPPNEPAATWWLVMSLPETIPGPRQLQNILQSEIQEGV